MFSSLELLFKTPVAFTAWIVGLILGITIHEFAHAWTATKLGDYTAKYKGRVSLNPLRHIDPLGIIFAIFLRVGWGKPVPINHNALHGKYDELKVAFAGPLSNILLATIIIIPLIFIDSFAGLTEKNNQIVLFFSIVATINLILAVFNLIPIPPLDGSHILYAISPASIKIGLEKLEKTGQEAMFLIVLIFLGMIMGFNIIGYIILYGIYYLLEPIIFTFGNLLVDIVKLLFSLF